MLRRWLRRCQRLVQPALLLLVLAGLALTPAIALANATEHVPWQTGTRLESGWQVSNLVRHPEFLRYELVRGAERTTLEVVADASPAGEWTTGRHRLQPGPGKPPDEALLRSLMPLLRQWEATRDRPALVPIGTSDPLQPQTQKSAKSSAVLCMERGKSKMRSIPNPCHASSAELRTVVFMPSMTTKRMQSLRSMRLERGAFWFTVEFLNALDKTLIRCISKGNGDSSKTCL